MITEDMKKQQMRVLKELTAKYPDKNVSVAWDFDSVVFGKPRMVTKVKELK
jgi:hypothetical protein